MVACIEHVPPVLGDYTFPGWAEGLGWAIAACSVLPIPGAAVVMWARQGGDPWEVGKGVFFVCFVVVVLS